MDVVELVKKYKGWELPETLNWLAEQVGITETKPQQPKESGITGQERIKTLTNIFEVFTRSFVSSGKPQEYLKSRNLDPRKIKDPPEKNSLATSHNFGLPQYRA